MANVFSNCWLNKTVMILKIIFEVGVHSFNSFKMFYASAIDIICVNTSLVGVLMGAVRYTCKFVHCGNFEEHNYLVMEVRRWSFARLV